MIAAGQTVGNYRILSKIGTGGMGAVYLAEHPTIGKKVAFKVIHADLAGNRDVVLRFFQEAKAVNRVGNEHIIEIHDFGVTPEGDHYYIMEYLEGLTLASLLARDTAIDVVRAMHIGAQIASALDAAHANGVIHRDLKPDNVMLTPRHGDPDFVKVLDFGLAKMFEAGTGVKTALGVLLGTPQYMSPEACESKRVLDGRTDIYALGVLLFQMMTGVLPFDGESMGEILVKQVTMVPPAPRALNPHIPPSVEQIVLRCLAKTPEARFTTMGELREALRDPEGYLRRSPPILPARSIAPGAAGVDAKQVLAYVAAEQAAKLRAPAAGSAVPAADGLRPGDMAALAPIAAPQNQTMVIGTPAGYVSRPPRRAWPFVVVAGVLLGLGGGVTAVVMFGPPRGVVASGSAMVPGTTGTNVPVATVDAATAVTVEAAAVTVDAAAIAAAPDSGMGTATGAGSAASGSAGSGSAILSAQITLESAPVGAAVYGPDHALLGKCPLAIIWPLSATPVQVELRLAGYKSRTKDIVVSGDASIHIELEKLPAAVPPHHVGTAPHPHDGVVRPGDI